MVVMNGDAITAGSKPIRFANMGSVQPTSFAQNTVQTIVRQITAATSGVTDTFPNTKWSINMSLAKLQTASVAPQTTATRISFQITFPRSENSISFSEIPRITDTLDWEPQFPPVSISMGIYAVSTVTAANASSNPAIICPVNVADTISSNSHGIRERNVSKTPVLRYGLSDGRIAAIFSISSVVSSCNTSIASSTVTMPTRRSSLSTTGSARKS